MSRKEGTNFFTFQRFLTNHLVVGGTDDVMLQEQQLPELTDDFARMVKREDLFKQAWVFVFQKCLDLADLEFLQILESILDCIQRGDWITFPIYFCFLDSNNIQNQHIC